MAWKWSSEKTSFSPKENSKKNNPIFKSEDAVNELLALSEDEMLEKLYQMELNQAVSVSKTLLQGDQYSKTCWDTLYFLKSAIRKFCANSILQFFF